jgi:RNA polymerase sigma-70 factor (ECF subfamily)
MLNPGAPASGTNPSIFLRLNAADARPREIAWNEFHDRYGPIIAAFARKLGVKRQDVDDLVQDVMVGFFGKAATFAYDPSRGRFRGYLKVCTMRAAYKRFGRDARRERALPLATLDEDAAQVEQVWNDVWEKQQLERAMADVREQLRGESTWRAFEQTVLHGRAPQEVADELGLTVSAVYKARERIGKSLRERIKQVQRELG